MAFGRPKGGARLDPLFTIPFALAAIFNLIPALIVDPPPTTQELVFVAGRTRSSCCVSSQRATSRPDSALSTWRASLS